MGSDSSVKRMIFFHEIFDLYEGKKTLQLPKALRPLNLGNESIFVVVVSRKICDVASISFAVVLVPTAVFIVVKRKIWFLLHFLRVFSNKERNCGG